MPRNATNFTCSHLDLKNFPRGRNPRIPAYRGGEGKRRRGEGVKAVVKFSRNGVPPPVSGVPPPEIAVPPPKVVVPPPGNDVPSPFGRKIIKIVAIRGQILRLKCTKYYFGWGSAPDPAGEITALTQNHYSWKEVGLLIRGMGGRKGKGGRGLRKGREGRERNVAFHHLLLSNLTTGQKQT